MFPEKILPPLTNPNLGSQTHSYGTGTHTSSTSSTAEAVLFFQPHWLKFHAFIYRKPTSAKTNCDSTAMASWGLTCNSLLSLITSENRNFGGFPNAVK